MGLIWPPDFKGELDRRATLYKAICEDDKLLAGAKSMYRDDPVQFIADCCWVYEPRNSSDSLPVKIPVVPFERQIAFIEWMHDRFKSRTSGPVEKSRDSGATWMASCFAVWLWLFYPGSASGFGSRKEALVDKKGDPGSIFEKIRIVVDNLPPCLLPEGYARHEHANYMRLINPSNDATIVGEGGDNIGRGGRTAMYFIDESAFIERPELVEASLTANTDCRIDISSPRVGTVFNESLSTADHKFVFDLRDAPWHTEEWIEKKKHELTSKGLGHLFAQEYLRDSTAGIEGQLIPAYLVEAAIDSHLTLEIDPSGAREAGMDVADGGRDDHAIAIRHGVLIEECKTQSGTRAAVGGRWAIRIANDAECETFRYDAIGVGSGVAAVIRDDNPMKFVGWSASGGVLWPEREYSKGRKNKDMFANANSQAWWMLRDRFIETFNAINGEEFDPDNIISISSRCENFRTLKTELSQVTYHDNAAGKVVINKAPKGHRSPNSADAVMIACAPERVTSGSLFGGFV